MVLIKGTAEKHRALISWLPTMHVLSGYKIVPKMCGVGKITALKTITQNTLRFLGNLQSTNSDVVQEVKQFVARCYGVKNCTKMSEKR